MTPARWSVALALGLAGAAGAAGTLRPSGDPARPSVQAQYRGDVDSLDATLSLLASLPAATPPDSAQRVFHRARSAYKRIEYLVGYQAPEVVIALNGAPLPRVDDHVRGAFQFADQRARSLEDQVAVVLENPREMGLPLASAVARLRSDSSLVIRFASVFGGSGSGAVSERRVQIALAAYVWSLGGARSRFDMAVRGDTATLTPAERRGFNLFMGKAACGTCHFAPLFGGTMPPSLLEAEPEVIGVPSHPVTRNATVDRIRACWPRTERSCTGTRSRPRPCVTSPSLHPTCTTAPTRRWRTSWTSTTGAAGKELE